ncbi:MAG: DUF1461 domain-containing protein [Nanoarchaeota archaeon]
MKLHMSIPKIFFWILTLSIVYMIFSSSFFNVLYDKDLFAREAEEFGTGESVERPLAKFQHLVLYFLNDDEYLQQPDSIFSDQRFSENELEHYKDVKDIISTVKTVYFAAFIAFIVLITGFSSSLLMKYNDRSTLKEKFALFFIKLQLSVLAVSALLLIVLAVPGLFAFQDSFNLFHEALFPQGNYRFPPDSLSMMLFPQEFFIDFFIEVLLDVLGFVLMLAVLFGFVYVLYRIRKRRRVPAAKDAE